MSSVTTETHTPPRFADAPYELTTDDFFHLVETDFFPEEARVYLEDGRIFEKMAKTNAHSGLGSLIPTLLIRRLPPGWSVFPEGQFTLDLRNSPLPDVLVARCADPRDFAESGRRPGVEDVGLIVEIAVTSLKKDLGPNLERYARSGVPNYWVADVNGQKLHIHSRPRVIGNRGEYERVDVIGPGGSFVLVLDGQEIGPFAYEDLMYRTELPPEPPL